MASVIPVADPSGLVGRQRELVSLRDGFDTRTRLLTIVGSPGVGKSRLGSEYLTASARTRRAIGVDLSVADRRVDLLSTVAMAVDANPRPTRCRAGPSTKGPIAWCQGEDSGAQAAQPAEWPA